MQKDNIKIGTVTYHRAYNYGAVLQAYALYAYLKKLGYDVEIVDYWPKHHQDVYKLWKPLVPNMTIKHVIFNIIFSPFIVLRYLKNKKRASKYERFIRQYMHLSSWPPSHEYEAVFYGSDTVWNSWKMNRLFSGFDEVYWGGDLIKAKHKFSYAPSMGNVIDSQDTINHCNRMLPKLDLISVRESNLLEKLAEWGWKDVTKVVDPTVLLHREDWNNIAKDRIIKKEYILCYNLEKSSIINELAKKIASREHLRIINLRGTVTNKLSRNEYDTAGPIEWVTLFRDAKYVLTSSFHGVVFSILFEKKFVFNSSCETERISSLLESCGIPERFINKADPRELERYIDYSNVNKKLDKMRTDSYEFINKCLRIAES